MVILLLSKKEKALSISESEARMDFLGNPEWEFIISASISIVSIGVGIWFALRRPAQIPLLYETIEIELVDKSENEGKELLKKLGVSADNEARKYFCSVTFKISNSGQESITLPDDSKPLAIAFKPEDKILYCEKCETIPDDLELTYKVNAEKLLLTFPLLDPQESIMFRMLFTNYVNYSPGVYVRIPGKKRIVRANNIRRSREMRIEGILLICFSILIFLLFSSGWISHNAMSNFYFISLGVLLLLAGMLFLFLSWIDRRTAPYPSWFILPSTIWYIWWRMLLRGLPALAIMAIIAAIIYFLFGLRVLGITYLITMCLVMPLGLWTTLYSAVKCLLQKRKKALNNFLIITLTGLPVFAFWGLCIYFFINFFM